MRTVAAETPIERAKSMSKDLGVLVWSEVGFVMGVPGDEVGCRHVWLLVVNNPRFCVINARNTGLWYD